MPDYCGWEKIRSLGEGGQGEVFLVRSPQRVSERREANSVIKTAVVRLNGIGRDADDHDVAAQRLANAVATYTRADAPDELGALKQYKLPQGDQGTSALQRLRNEIQALYNLKGESAVLQPREVNAEEQWIITDFHSRGSLSKYPEMFTGDIYRTLNALQPIVAVLAKLHAKGTVHRDIKLQNTLVSDTGELVLGDFGIVFLEGGNRPTEQLERVWSRDWMPPWAHTGMRVDDVKPSFDVFPLGKMIWCMISGRTMLPFWYHREPQNDLTKLFPHNTAMHLVNEVLDRCVVQHEKDCLSSASELLKIVDETIDALRVGGEPVSDGIPRRCRVCGRGHYRRIKKDSASLAEAPTILVDVYGCESCGHIQMFGQRDAQYTSRAGKKNPRFWGLPL